MQEYTPSTKVMWNGRKSDSKLYLHEKIQCVDLNAINPNAKNHKSFALLGYACHEGVLRNKGRIGAAAGPDAIRHVLGKMPNHLKETTGLFDYGNILCPNGDMEKAQINLANAVTQILQQNTFPILLGGGHDIAYGHYNGIQNYSADKKIGIINFDAHFDLRSNSNGANSGTPFFQIAEDSAKQGKVFNYFCLGIRRDANNRKLFETADTFGVKYIENINFTMDNAKTIVRKLLNFLQEIEHVYVSIDLDGFSSAFAPGVSASSPMGFSPNMVLKALEVILASKKLISLDIAELNPNFDIDNQTSKLAASLIHFIISSVE